MPVNSFPWTGTSPGSAGPYSAAQVAAFLQGLLGKGAASYSPNTGVVWYSNQPNVPPGTQTGFGLDVQAQASPNMTVIVNPGSAVANGTLVENTAQVTLTVTSNASGFTRIDTVVVHLDYNAQTAVIQLNAGTPSGSPVPPALVQSALIWEIPVADITVANGAASITNANIQPRALPAYAPDGVYIPVYNNSGAVLQTGDVVSWDTSAAQAVKAPGIVSTPLDVAGVMVGRTAIGALGLLLVRGVGWVNTQAAVTAGNMLVAYGKQAASFAGVYGGAATYGAFAYALTTSSGAGLSLAYIDASNIGLNNANFQKPFASYYVATGADYSLSVATTWTEIDTAFRLGVHTTQGRVKLEADFVCDMTGGAGDVIFDWYRITDNTMFNAAGEARAVGTASYPLSSIPFHVSAYFTGMAKDTSYVFTLRYFKNSGAMNLRRNGWPIVLTAQDF